MLATVQQLNKGSPRSTDSEILHHYISKLLAKYDICMAMLNKKEFYLHDSWLISSV